MPEPTPAPSSPASRLNTMLPLGWLLALCYGLSGLTSLAYEVLWVRMLSLQFGVSIFGVVVTVAAFMGGLGVGSLAGVRLASRRSPLLIFAALEAGIAVYALLLPLGMQGLDVLLAEWAPSLSLFQWYLLQGTSVVVMLFVPACAMGMGFPLVLRAAAPTPRQVGWFYGLNAVGAAFGAMLPLLLLPTLGWTRAVQTVAALGFAVAALALWLAPWLKGTAPSAPRLVRPPFGPLLAYAGIGMAALMLEVGWTRLLGMLLLRTEYVLAVILAVFLAGIGLGSLLARHERAQWWLTLLPSLAALWVLAGLAALPWVGGWAESAEFASLGTAVLGDGAVIAAITLPVTLALGAWLPLLSAHHARDLAAPAPILYGANSVGAALGAVLAGIVLVPWLGSAGTVVVAAWLLFACGMVWARRRYASVIALGLLGLGIAVWDLPPVSELLPRAYGDSQDLMVHEDAIATTHIVAKSDGQRVLLADLQRMDASSAPSAVTAQKNQARLPLLLHHDPQSVLFLGMGTGISVAGSLPYPDLERVGVEISRGAIKAARRWFTPVNDDALTQTQVHRDDARRYLAATQRRFDIIIGDLFHPDLAGRSSLLSVQQFRRVRQRLSADGVFAQWVALNQLDVEALQVVLRSFHQVFPQGRLYLDGFRLAMVGAKAAVAETAAVKANLAQLGEARAAAATGDEGAWTWLGRYMGSVRVGEGPLQSEWSPTIEYHLPSVRYRGQLDTGQALDWLLQRRPRLGQAAQQLGVEATDRKAFERAYAATELAARSWLAQFRDRGQEAQRLLRFAFEANPQDQWVATTLADRMLSSLEQRAPAGLSRRQALERILTIAPDHAPVLRALWQLERSAGREEAAERYRQRLSLVSPLDQALAPDSASGD